MSRRKKFRNADDGNDIDLTPMLDVVFIMLIFFIVTASFVKESGIRPNVPDPTNKPQTDTENLNILVRISADDQIWLMEKEGERRVDGRAVRSNLERMRAELPKAAVIIQADPKSSAGVYVEVADAAREAKAPNVVLVPLK